MVAFLVFQGRHFFVECFYDCSTIHIFTATARQNLFPNSLQFSTRMIEKLPFSVIEKPCVIIDPYKLSVKPVCCRLCPNGPKRDIVSKVYLLLGIFKVKIIIIFHAEKHPLNYVPSVPAPIGNPQRRCLTLPGANLMSL